MYGSYWDFAKRVLTNTKTGVKMLHVSYMTYPQVFRWSKHWHIYRSSEDGSNGISMFFIPVVRLFFIKHTDFDNRFLCLPDQDVGVTGRQGMLIPPTHLISPVYTAWVCVCPTPNLVFLIEVMRLINVHYLHLFLCKWWQLSTGL